MSIFWISFQITVNIFESAVFCYFIQKHFPGNFSKSTNQLINIAAVMIMSGVYTGYMFFPPLWIIDYIGLLLCWLLYVLLFRKGLWYEKSFWCVLIISANSLCAVAAVTWAMYILGASQYTIALGQDEQRFILVTGTKAIQVLVIFYFSKLYVSSLKLQKKTYMAIISLLLVCEIISLTILEIGFVMGDNLVLMFYLAVSSVCLIAILMITYYLYYKISRQSELLLKAQSELQYKTLMEQHNKELIKIDTNMKSWRHDFHNHIQTLMVLSRSGNISKLESYVEGLGQKLGDVDEVCDTGQHALDAIVTVKHSIARLDKINLNLSITPIALLPISEVDVAILLGNLFDNAIEACRRLETEKRSIDLFLGMMEHMIYIRMTNSTDGIDNIENGKFLTTKSDDGLHGLGLASIDRIVDLADGHVQREHRDGVFSTVLLLPAGR